MKGSGAGLSRARQPKHDVNEISRQAIETIMSHDLDKLKQLKALNIEEIYKNHGLPDDKWVKVDIHPKELLTLAIKNNDTDIVKHLFQKGATVTLDSEEDDAFSVALRDPKVPIEMITAILDGATAEQTHLQQQLWQQTRFLYDDKGEYSYGEYLTGVFASVVSEALLMGRRDIVQLFIDRKLINFANEDTASSIIIRLLYVLKNYQDFSKYLASRETILKMLDFVLKQGAIIGVFKTETWSNKSVSQPVIDEIIHHNNPIILGVFLQNRLDINSDKIINGTTHIYDPNEEKVVELSYKEVLTKLAKEYYDILDKSNIKIIPELLNQMRKVTDKDEFDENLTPYIGKFLAGGKKRTSKRFRKGKTNRKKHTHRKSKKRST